MIVVYRIEHSIDGIGFIQVLPENRRHYSAEIICPGLDYRHLTTFPCARDEGIDIMEGIKFAFRSKKIMTNNIYQDEFLTLVKNGYRIYRIKLRDDCQKREYNVGFLEKHIIQKTDITDEFISTMNTVKTRRDKIIRVMMYSLSILNDAEHIGSSKILKSNIDYSLCDILKKLMEHGVIDRFQWLTMRSFIMKYRPNKKKTIEDYWWPANDYKSRVSFLNMLLKIEN